MSIFNRHAEITKTWRGLPNTQNVASYNFVDQLILFDMMESQHVTKSLSALTLPERWPLIREATQNGWHEYTHWLDMTSSVFGLRWLCKVVNLLERYPADGQNASSDYVEECKAATREMKSIHLPEYYSTVENPVGQPWKYSTTVGQAYDSQGNSNPNHPLWFVRFDTPDDISIARQPISVASLLEVRAVKAEIIGGLGLIGSLRDLSFKEIQKQRLRHDIFSRVYNPHLTVYSAAAHWYANQREVTDVMEAYTAASKLAWFCLDAATQWVTSIKATSSFRAQMGEPFAAMMNTSLSRDDRGALFFMLASEKRLRSARSMELDLDALLCEEWNVSLREVQKVSEKERANLANQLICTPGLVGQLAAIWMNNLGQRKLDRPLSVGSPNTQLPAVILKDGTPFDIFRMQMGDGLFNSQIFDPRPYLDEFWIASRAMTKYGKYSEFGDHCFSVASS